MNRSTPLRANKTTDPNLALNEAIFWDRLLDMPDIEAAEELKVRKEELVLQNAMLLNERASARNRVVESELGLAMSENNALLTKINDRLKFVNERMNRLCWREAVKACFGEDGFLQCVQWMEANR